MNVNVNLTFEPFDLQCISYAIGCIGRLPTEDELRQFVLAAVQQRIAGIDGIEAMRAWYEHQKKGAAT